MVFKSCKDGIYILSKKNYINVIFYIANITPVQHVKSLYLIYFFFGTCEIYDLQWSLKFQMWSTLIFKLTKNKAGKVDKEGEFRARNIILYHKHSRHNNKKIIARHSRSQTKFIKAFGFIYVLINNNLFFFFLILLNYKYKYKQSNIRTIRAMDKCVSQFRYYTLWQNVWQRLLIVDQ